MTLEERVERLEEQVTNKEEWVTPKELSEIMKCSTNNIYIKIRKGDIYATDKLGSILRIPMSQFYNEKEEVEAIKEAKSIKERVFG